MTAGKTSLGQSLGLTQEAHTSITPPAPLVHEDEWSVAFDLYCQTKTQ